MAKKKLKIYKLHFTTPLHLGDVRDDYSVSLKTISSDTIYSALISCLAKYGCDVPNNGDLGCTISSLFPFYQKEQGDDNVVLFFPKPLRQGVPDISDVSNAKKIKKILWLDSHYFCEAIKGETIFNDQSVCDIHGDFLTKFKDLDKDFMSTSISPRVTITSRLGDDDADPFYMDRLYFKDYSGMFFIADGDVTLLEKALSFLKNEGVGTDRNVGNGFFEYDCEKDITEIELDLPDESEYALSLSSFVPETEEQLKEMLEDDNVAYDFQRRGGWITEYPYNTIRKNSVYAFVCGSVFKKNVGLVESLGKVDIDLNPELQFNKIGHPIWRCGRSLFIPIKI